MPRFFRFGGLVSLAFVASACACEREPTGLRPVDAGRFMRPDAADEFLLPDWSESDAASPGTDASSLKSDGGSCGSPADLRGCACSEAGAKRACYSGPHATRGVGSCREGNQACNANGELNLWVACSGERLPAQESCGSGRDDDCDGLVDCADPDCATSAGCQSAGRCGTPFDQKACPCGKQNASRACYDGPAGTRGVGACKDGAQVCLSSGEILTFGACAGATLPKPEACQDGIDNDCDGQVDCNDSDCGGSAVCTGGCSNSANLKACPCGQQNASRPCYDGPADSRGRGACRDGTQLCLSSGEILTWGNCTGATVPGPEACQDGVDNDCDDLIDCKDQDCATASICIPECAIGTTDPCYTGPPGTLDLGICKPGKKTCGPDGKWGPCLGDVKPGKKESYFNFDNSCRDGIDNDCNGIKDCNEAMCLFDPYCAPTVCTANQTRPCYTGPAGTQNVGPCRGGTQTCAPDGKSWGPCKGEVLPQSEDTHCADKVDNDCNHKVDCADAACSYATNCCTPTTPGAPVDTTIWAHSSDTLYRVDPRTFAVTTVGDFNVADSMTDLAVTPNGELYTISFTALYRVSKTNGSATYVAKLSGAVNNGLTFLTDGSLLAAEGGGTGNVRRIDPTTGGLTSVGAYGNGLSSSGDLVAVNSVMYGISSTLPGGADASGNNVLMRVDVATGKATVVGAIGFGNVWGLAYANQKVIAFTTSGQIIEVDPQTGKGSLLATKSIDFWGAGMSPKVPVGGCQ